MKLVATPLSFGERGFFALTARVLSVISLKIGSHHNCPYIETI